MPDAVKVIREIKGHCINIVIRSKKLDEYVNKTDDYTAVVDPDGQKSDFICCHWIFLPKAKVIIIIKM